MARIDKYTKEELASIVANSISMREVVKKVGYTACGCNHKTVQRRLDEFNISTKHFVGVAREVVKRCPENIFVKDSTASQAVMRRWYIKGCYSEYKCSICGQEPFWNGKPMTLILDHINGNNTDHRIENLRWVCPNCNQQLDTTNGKNKKDNRYNKAPKKYCIDCGKEISRNAKRCHSCNSKHNIKTKYPVTRDELKTLVKNNSFLSIGKKYGVSDSAIRKWCKKFGIPYKHNEIKSYSDEEWEKI